MVKNRRQKTTIIRNRQNVSMTRIFPVSWRGHAALLVAGLCIKYHETQLDAWRTSPPSPSLVWIFRLLLLAENTTGRWVFRLAVGETDICGVPAELGNPAKYEHAKARRSAACTHLFYGASISRAKILTDALDF
jgi:hypothetical protein